MTTPHGQIPLAKTSPNGRRPAGSRPGKPGPRATRGPRTRPGQPESWLTAGQRAAGRCGFSPGRRYVSRGP
jgi:hypothetical protein